MDEMVVPVENQKFTAFYAGDHGNAQLLGEFKTHVGDAGSGNQNVYFHQCRFHHNFGSQTARAVKNPLLTADTLQPHFSGNGVGGIVAPDIFHEYIHLILAAERTAMHGTGGLVNLVV